MRWAPAALAASIAVVFRRIAVSPRAPAETTSTRDARSKACERLEAHGFTTYLDSKVRRELTADPVEDLKAGWDLHVGFGLANPAVFSLMHGEPRGGASPPAAVAAAEVLDAHIHRIADVGRLRVPEQRAANFLHTAAYRAAYSGRAVPAQPSEGANGHCGDPATLRAIGDQICRP